MVYKDVGVIATFLKNDQSYDMDTCFYLSNIYYHLSFAFIYGLPLVPDDDGTKKYIKEEYIRLASSDDSAFHHSNDFFQLDTFDPWHLRYVNLITALYHHLYT